MKTLLAIAVCVLCGMILARPYVTPIVHAVAKISHSLKVHA